MAAKAACDTRFWLWPISDVAFERATAVIEQVVPDVPFAIADTGQSSRAREIDGTTRRVKLRLSCRLRNPLDRLALSIAAEKIHSRVHAGRIVAQRLIDKADGFEVLPPIERAAQTKTRDRVRDRHLRRRLTLMFLACDVLDGQMAHGEVRVDGRSHGCETRPVLAQPLQEMNDKRRVEGRGQRRGCGVLRQ